MHINVLIYYRLVVFSNFSYKVLQITLVKTFLYNITKLWWIYCYELFTVKVFNYNKKTNWINQEISRRIHFNIKDNGVKRLCTLTLLLWVHITFSNIIYSEVVLSEQYIMVKARPTVRKTQPSNETEQFYWLKCLLRQQPVSKSNLVNLGCRLPGEK